MSLITRGFGAASGEVKAITNIDLEMASKSYAFEITNTTIAIEITDDGGIIDMISIKQGEAKTLTFTITEDGASLDLSKATLSFAVKEQKTDTEYIIEKTLGNFDVSGASIGKVSITLSSTDTDIDPESYVAELRVEINPSNIYKSDDIDFIVEKSVFN